MKIFKRISDRMLRYNVISKEEKLTAMLPFIQYFPSVFKLSYSR